jgi:acyl dehydratase
MSLYLEDFRYTDHEFARASDFGRPIAHGLLALIVSAGLADRDGSSDGTNLALLGLSWRGAPQVGEHSREVLVSAGLTPADTDALVRDGIVAAQ